MYDPQFAQGASLPSWLKILPPATADSSLAEIDFEVASPAEAKDLLVTVIFDEKDGGFLRVYRKDADHLETISENLFEGTSLPNRRTLLISKVTATTIVFQASGKTSPIRRILWQWAAPATLPGADIPADAAAVAGRAILTNAEVSGQPLLPPASSVEVGYTSSPLLDRPTKVDNAVAFTVGLDRIPAHARIEGKITGLPSGAQLDCWVGGRRVGPLSAFLPSLKDPAYLFPEAGAPTLAGWQAGAAYIPQAAWQKGDNQVELRPSDPATPLPKGFAIKDFVLEAVYGEEKISPPAPSPAPENAAP